MQEVVLLFEFSLHIRLDKEQCAYGEKYFWQLSVSTPYHAERNIVSGWAENYQEAIIEAEKKKEQYITDYTAEQI